MILNLVRRLVVQVVMLPMVAACGASAPVRYHTLVRPDPAGVEVSGAARVLVEILPIAVPDSVTRDALVLTAPSGQVTVMDQDRWLAPVADEVRQLVADSLWRAVRAADTYQAPVPAGTPMPRFRLALRLERFDAVPGQAATVVGSWTLRGLPDGPVRICRWAETQSLAAPVGAAPVGGTAAGDAAKGAAGLADGSRRLADQIGESLRRAANGETDVCP